MLNQNHKIICILVLLSSVPKNEASSFVKLHEDSSPHQCVPLRVPSCQNLGYNMTSFPNFLGTRSHVEAEESMISYNPWLQYGCSSELRLFLCGFYAPMCSPAGHIVPCQSFCKFVRSQCSPILITFGYSWPADLDCSRLPASNTPGNLCMESPVHSRQSQTEFSQSKNRGSCDGAADCPCDDNAFRVASFSSRDKEFASVWMAIWSVVCFGVTIFTLVSFILSRTRYGFLESWAFRYPDRCCLHMVGCYCLVSAGYFMRLGLGPSSTTCASTGQEDHGIPPISLENREIAVLDTPCVLVFLLLYYFTNAAAVWFCVLCCCWLGGVWRGWGHTALLRGAVYMHLLAWGVPAVLAILVLNRRILMPDQLTGTCYAGHGSSVATLRWVLLPLLLPLLLGTSVLMLAFATLWRVQLAINKRLPQYFADASAAGYIGSAPCCIIGADRGCINGPNPCCASAELGQNALQRSCLCYTPGHALCHVAGHDHSPSCGQGYGNKTEHGQASNTTGHGHGNPSTHGYSNTTGYGYNNMSGQDHSKTTGHSHSNTTGHSHNKTTGHSHSNTTGHSHNKTAGHSHNKTTGHSHSNTTAPGRTKTPGPRDRDGCKVPPSFCSSKGVCRGSTSRFYDFSQSRLEAGSNRCHSQRDGRVDQCNSKCVFRGADFKASLCYQAGGLTGFQTPCDLERHPRSENKACAAKSYVNHEERKAFDHLTPKRREDTTTENKSPKGLPIATSCQGIDISSKNRSVPLAEVPTHSCNQFSRSGSEEQRHWERLSGSCPEVRPKSNKTAAKCQHEDRQIEDPDGPSLTFHSKASKKSNKYTEVEQRRPAAALPADIARRPAQKAARIGVVAVLYMLPTACLVGAVFQESTQRDRWQQDPSKPPSIEVFMLKIFTSLAPGIALSLFLGNNRVMLSWRELGQRLYAIHDGAQNCPPLQREHDEKSYCWAYRPDTAFRGHQCLQKLQSQVHGMDDASQRRSCRHHNCYSGHVPSDEPQKPPQCKEKLRVGEAAKPILKRTVPTEAGPSAHCKNAAFLMTTEGGSAVRDTKLHGQAHATAGKLCPSRHERVTSNTTPPNGRNENLVMVVTSDIPCDKTKGTVVPETSKITSNPSHFDLYACDSQNFSPKSVKNHHKSRGAVFAEEEAISGLSSSDRISGNSLELCQNFMILSEVSSYENEHPSHALSPTNGRKEQCSLRPGRETLPFADPERRELSSPNSGGKKQDEGPSKKTLKNKRQKDKETSL